eukprot:6123556-Pyramimonas_sp.AAC.1
MLRSPLCPRSAFPPRTRPLRSLIQPSLPPNSPSAPLLSIAVVGNRCDHSANRVPPFTYRTPQHQLQAAHGQPRHGCSLPTRESLGAAMGGGCGGFR